MRTFLIGLGGSGIEVVTRLKKDLQTKLDAVSGRQREILEQRFGDVSCVVMDTDQRDKKTCVDLGIQPIILSGAGSVSNYLHALKTANDDVYDWCPNTRNEAAFLSEQLDDGASQCRMKSRLCLGVFLKNELNDLSKVFDRTLEVAGDLNEETLRFMVISSIAGGTGSGIFIQIALYIKTYMLKKFNLNVKVYGLFACPDLYKKKVPQAQWESIYANAYAAVRELNAINIIYGNAAKNEYGRNIKIKISSKAEGELFNPADKGQFGKRPFDQLYFIDDVNAYGGVIANLDEYYDIMANFVYTRMFSPISKEFKSAESNEMESHSIVPLAIYGSAGAATMKYPYEDIVSYLASRYLCDSVSNVWTAFDKLWHDYVKRKEAAERAKGYLNYRPAPGERGTMYINDYGNAVYRNADEQKNRKFAFLRAQLEVEDSSLTPTKVTNYMSALEDEAMRLIRDDVSLSRLKDDNGITESKITKSCENMAENISKKEGIDADGAFGKVISIDNGVSLYADACAKKIDDLYHEFAQNILCTSPKMWNENERQECNIVTGLLSVKSDDGNESPEMLHPLAVRYLLYCLKRAIDEKMQEIVGEDESPKKTTLNSFYGKLKKRARAQKTIIDPNKEDGIDEATLDVLAKLLKKAFGGEKRAKTSINEYRSSTIGNIKSMEKATAKAVLFFALNDVNAKLADMIATYEIFFDRIDDYQDALQREVNRLEADRNAPGKTTIYVGAAPMTKRKLYAEASAKLNPDSGTAAGAISRSFYNSVRDILWADEENTGHVEIRGLETFFASVKNCLTDFINNDSTIRTMLDKDVFQAMLDDYTAEHGAAELDRFDPNGNNQSPFAAYLKKMFSELVVRSAPMLNYDNTDPYAVYNARTEEEQNRIRVSHPYMFLELNPNIASTIRNKLYINETNNDDAMHKLIADCMNERGARLPTFERDKVRYVENEWRTAREIFLVSTVHCLQPYQISKFDELKNGDYYKYYTSRIDSVLKSGILSTSPHLDKRWHLHGMMPYINISKELESRYALAKAFVFTLLYGLITCTVEKKTTYYHYYDPEIGGVPETLSYKSLSITNNDLAKILYWLMNKEDLVKRYAAEFDRCMESEELKLAATEYVDVRGYEALMTRNIILRRLRENLIRAGYAKNAFTKEGQKFRAPQPIGILKIAALVRASEEASTDYDYAEIIINVAEEVIYRFARAPFSDEQIRSEQTAEHKTAFHRIVAWSKLKFMLAYCDYETERRGLNKPDDKKKDDEAEKDEGEQDGKAGGKGKKGKGKKDAEPENDKKKGAKGAQDDKGKKGWVKKDYTEPETDDDLPDRSEGKRITTDTNDKPPIEELDLRGVPSKVLSTTEFNWINTEFRIDPDMNIPRPSDNE